ncbi:MAG: TlpA family protein disulfide reductase [Chloroflexales bacterium]|nr:TlpA family protein disulfide reductase [Chloroflexales bacterium]
MTDVETGSAVSAMVAPTSMLLDASDEQAKVGAIAPDFSFTLADGSTQKLSDLRGQKILVNFWATWCAPCKVEMPEIQEALKRYDSDGFAVLAISNENAEAIDTFARQNNFTFPLISNQDGDIGDHYGVTGFPVSFFINSDGTIGFKQIGIMNLDLITQRVEALQ